MLEGRITSAQKYNYVSLCQVPIVIIQYVCGTESKPKQRSCEALCDISGVYDYIGLHRNKYQEYLLNYILLLVNSIHTGAAKSKNHALRDRSL